MAGSPAAALAEAALLAAVVVAPLFFNPTTERVFEPDKLAWVTILAGMAVVGVLQPLLAKGAPRSAAAPSALPLAAALVVAAGLVGTAFSVVPAVSLWGSYRRGQGAVTLVAFGLLFLATGRSLRAGRRRDRLVRALAIGLLPTSAYALLQWFGVDSVAWEQTGPAPTDRAFGPLGNPIFLGAYLVMALPMVAQAAVVRMQVAGGRGAGDRRRPHRTAEGAKGRGGRRQRASASGGATLGLSLSAAGYGLVFAVGLAALGAAVSRGPILGAAAALGSALIIVLAVVGRRRSARVLVVAAAIVGIVGLTAVGAGIAGDGPRQGSGPATSAAAAGSLVDAPGAAAEAVAAKVWSSRTARERILLWGLVVDMATQDPARALVGYGPDTLAYVVTPRLTKELARLTPDRLYDRTHNVFLEAWTTAGALGLAALVTLYAVALAAGLSFLGLGRGPAVVAAAAMVGALAGGVAGYAALPALAPLGSAAGLIAGALLAATGRGRDHTRGPTAPSGRDRWLVGAIVVALVGHLAEGSFGLPTAAGGLLFWLYLGILWAVTRGPGRPDGGRAASRGRDAAGGPRRVAAAQGRAGADAAAEGLVDGLALATVAFAPLLLPSPVRTAAVPLLWVLVPAVWIAGDVMADASSRSPWPRPLARLAILLVLLTLFAFHPLAGPAGPALAFAATLVVGVVALAVALAGTRPREGSQEWMPTLAVVVAGILVALGSWHFALRPVMADAHVRSGLRAAAEGSIDDTIRHFAAATRLWPEQPEYATYVAAADRDVALNPSVGADASPPDLTRAMGLLESSLLVAPSADRMAKLATLHRDAGDASPVGGAGASFRPQEWNRAVAWYEAALERWPMAPAILTDYAATLERLGTTDGAAAIYAQALDIDPGNAAAWAGLVRLRLAAGDVDGARAAAAAGLAADPRALGEALAAAADFPVDQHSVALSRALHLALTDRGEAAREVLAAAGIDPIGNPVARRLLDLAAP